MGFTRSGGEPMPVEQGTSLPLLPPCWCPKSAIVQPSDALTNWADGRGQSIAADNAITQQIDEDPDAAAGSGDSFSYFPLVGVPAIGPGMSSVYSSLYPTQPGFNSIYLPGYTYRPYIFGMMGSPLRPYSIYPSRRITGSPGIGSYISPSRTPYPVRSAYPTYTSRPSFPVRTPGSAPTVRPGVSHAAPRMGGVHVGAHR